MTYTLYTGAAPHVKHSSTSQKAAEAIQPKISAMQGRILALIRSRPAGLTRDQVEIITGLSHQTSSARMRELVLKGLIETRIAPGTTKSIRRPTRTGRTAEVLFAVP